MDKRGLSARGDRVPTLDPATGWLRLAGHGLWIAGATGLAAAAGAFLRVHIWIWLAAGEGETVPGRRGETLSSLFHRFDDEHQWFIMGLCLIPILAGYAILSFSPRVPRSTRR